MCPPLERDTRRGELLGEAVASAAHEIASHLMLVGLADPRGGGEPVASVDPGPLRRALSEMRLAVHLLGPGEPTADGLPVPPTTAAEECRARLDRAGLRSGWHVAPECDELAGTSRVSLGALFAALETCAQTDRPTGEIALDVRVAIDEVHAIAHLLAVVVTSDPRRGLRTVQDRIELAGGRLVMTRASSARSEPSWAVEAWLPT